MYSFFVSEQAVIMMIILIDSPTVSNLAEMAILMVVVMTCYKIGEKRKTKWKNV